MSDRRDIIRWTFDWLLAHEDSISQELALLYEHDARREWGGQTVGYVARTSEADRRARRNAERQAYTDLLGNAPIDDISRRSGLSRASLYRLVKRGPAAE